MKRRYHVNAGNQSGGLRGTALGGNRDPRAARTGIPGALSGVPLLTAGRGAELPLSPGSAGVRGLVRGGRERRRFGGGGRSCGGCAAVTREAGGRDGPAARVLPAGLGAPPGQVRPALPPL